MKSSKSAPTESSTHPSGSRRSQPLRMTRNNLSRPSGLGTRNYGSKASVSTAPEEATPIEIFPGITHFADAISALPKELVRHFTLLKEVDAKIFMPEEELTRLVSDALNASLPPCSQLVEVKGQYGLESSQSGLQNCLESSYLTSCRNQTYSTLDTDAVWDPANFNRRQLFKRCALTMQGMLVSLDEKNHVISTAGEALAKQLARIDDCLPFIELEVSEEARNGSMTHWAYTENRNPKASSNSVSRKDQPGSQISTGAHQVAEDVATRSDARKQALLEKRKNRNQHVESDLYDQSENKSKDKKLQGNVKVRKGNDASGGAGAGIPNSSTTNGNPQKRRKVEKAPANCINSDRSTNLSTNSNVIASKGRPVSPRSTPQPEVLRKRSRTVPTSSNGSINRKRNNVVTSAVLSPPSASPPTSTTVSDVKKADKPPSPPANSCKLPSNRCRRNSIQSNNEKQPPSPSINMSNDNSTLDLCSNVLVTRNSTSEIDTPKKDVCSNHKGEKVHDHSDQVETKIGNGTVISNRKECSVQLELSVKNLDTNIVVQTPIATTTKSGRTSKPSTPAISSFPEQFRSRVSRTPLDNLNNKRSHKKGTGASTQAIAITQRSGLGDTEKKNDQDDEDIEVEAEIDEPRYCYCNNVSYGEMVGCDAEACKREWFHLACVGLRTAPKGNAKWYCEDCKDIMKGKRSSHSR